MWLIRVILILSVLLAAYTAALVVYLVQYAWLVPVLVAVWLLRKKPSALWSHGTARWADTSEMEGMFDE